MEDVLSTVREGKRVAVAGPTRYVRRVGPASVNVGFFGGAQLADPKGLLEGSGTFMRHVRLRPDRTVDETALRTLIETAYVDMKTLLRASR